MTTDIGSENIDVLVLCGGMGTRLRSVVSDRPKPMALFGQHTFLDFLIDYVSEFGFRRFILCVGYMKERIVYHYMQKSRCSISAEQKSLEIICSEESVPLGTAGAIKNAQSHILSDPFVVVNGDSFFAIDFNEFLLFHLANEAEATIALKNYSGGDSYGAVCVESEHRIVAFIEKQNVQSDHLINGGIYLFNRSVLSLIPAQVESSLEYNLFPSLTGRRFLGYIGTGDFIDIGTPERFEKAKGILKPGRR